MIVEMKSMRAEILQQNKIYWAQLNAIMVDFFLPLLDLVVQAFFLPLYLL
jgi:hypothetical protein